MVNKILGVAMIAGTLFLGSCASNSSSSEGKEARIEEVTSTLDNVNEINFKNKKNVLLDVRTPEEFAEGHVPGAVNIDVKNPNFEEEIQKLDTKKNYFIYCKSGVRAKLATEKMQEKGFKNAKNFKDGMSTYKGTVVK
ncbi:MULTISPECIES: rhodanese-like domain-containing protein [unclassified Empedobacter]|uniref:rhodanese-like domain-containing protein n=1 Tax=unclassified Empedobacter TaxID=2643773 RepID=UPI002449ED0C|nr:MULTISPECIES: rhodanese-like domain-containing protein [unclassified Empedobacter]MDH1601403.1 rhodanese-like domain-containing protein [Empedobacter sp. GD03739]